LLHLLEATVKNAWRSGKVVLALFLDIEGAFPNAVMDKLLHNMRKRRIPEPLVTFTSRVLTNRKTKLSFDGYLSDWISITNGIGQGNPLSMILYIIYNSDLVKVAKIPSRSELTLAFVDDILFITIRDNFCDTHHVLQDMLNRQDRAFDWSRDHNSKFETTKFAIMNFSLNKTKECPPLIVQGKEIKATPFHRFLGVLVDEDLRWHKHATYAIGKGTAYVLQLRRLSLSAKGIPLSLMRQLYTSVALPKMLYAVDLWIRPLYIGESDTAQRGSVGVIKQLGKIQ
jgi:hypothetical protein